MAKKKIIAQKFALSTTASASRTDGEVELVALAFLPASPFRTQDGRSGIEFSYDGSQMAALASARKRRLVVDVEHNTEYGDNRDTRARGWVHSLTNAELEPGMGFEPGVTYAWVELTPLGKQELADKLYGFTSAVVSGYWEDENKFVLTRAKSLTLTNNPATEMPANFTAEDGEDDEDSAPEGVGYTSQQTELESAMLTKLREKLGLSADADVAAIEAAVDAALAPKQSEAESALQAAGFTAQDIPTLVKPDTLTAQLTAAQSEVVSLTAQLKELKQAETERQVLSAVDAVIAERKAVPAQRDALIESARANLAAFTNLFKNAPVVAPDLSAAAVGSAPAAKEDETFGLTAEDLAKAKAGNFTPQAYAAGKRAAEQMLAR